MGDIEQAYASNQGFMHAEFPIHQQGQLAIMGRDMEDADIIRGVDVNRAAQTYTLDKQFTPDPAHMVTGVEVRKGKIYEVEAVHAGSCAHGDRRRGSQGQDLRSGDERR